MVVYRLSYLLAKDRDDDRDDDDLTCDDGDRDVDAAAVAGESLP